MRLHTLDSHALAPRFFQLDNRIDGPKVTSETNVIINGPFEVQWSLENILLTLDVSVFWIVHVYKDSIMIIFN